MKKNKLKAIALLLATTLVIPGCIKSPVSSEIPSPSEPVVEPVDTTWDRPQQKDVVADNLPVVQHGNAVKYDGKILFRAYDKTAYEYSSLFADFGTANYQYCPSALYTYDVKNAADTAEYLYEDSGYGDLYLVNGYLYSQVITDLPDPETYKTNTTVYRLDLATGDSEPIGDGAIEGFSEDGKYLYVVDYNYNPFSETHLVYDANTFDIAGLYATDESMIYIGNNGASAFYYIYDGKTSPKAVRIYQLTNDGKLFILGDADLSNIGEYPSYPESNPNMTVVGDKISFNVHFFEGTGHFYASSLNITVQYVTDPSATPENLSPLYSTTLTEYNDVDENPMNPCHPRLKDIQWVTPENPNSGFVSSLQYAEQFDEGVFYVTCDAVRNPFEDIGWRYSYTFLNARYKFLPNDSDEAIEMFTLFDPAGTKGDIMSLDPNKVTPTITVMAFFPSNDGLNFDSICYQPVSISGPEGPIEECEVFLVDEVADVFLYEYPEEDIYEPFTIDNFEKFKAHMSAIASDYSPYVPPVYDYEGNLTGDDSTMKQKNAYFCHIGFDYDGKINYVRPVIWD